MKKLMVFYINTGNMLPEFADAHVAKIKKEQAALCEVLEKNRILTTFIRTFGDTSPTRVEVLEL